MVPSISGIVGRVESHLEIFDLTKANLGRELLEIAAHGIEQNLYNEVDIEGNPFAPLSPDYEKWKSTHYPGVPIGELDFIMKQPTEITGTQTIDPDSAEMIYGVTQTGQLHATWFQEGSAIQPPRPFYGLTKEAIAESTQFLNEHFESSI